VTGLYDEAKNHILAFASCIRHGLIPNLLDSGRKPRYNARDSVWWFLQAIQEYCERTGSFLILDELVNRRFPGDDYIEENDEKAYKTRSTLRDIMQEIMQRHASGIHFTEWNAGPNLDHAMKCEGFRIDIELDLETGFIFGGNEWNCGTWMDKMVLL
jgi:glycogen debranching enzyme